MAPKVAEKCGVQQIIQYTGTKYFYDAKNKNMPLPTSKNSHFQNKDKCKTFLVKISFICMHVFHTFLMILLERFCSNITTFHLW